MNSRAPVEAQTKSYAAALIVGSVSTLGALALHPEGQEVLTQHGSIMMLMVHLVLLVNIGLLAFGCCGIVRRLGIHRADMTAGMVAYGFAMCAVVVPIAISAFVIPGLESRLSAIDKIADPITQKALMQSMSLCEQFIQGFVKTFVPTYFIAIAFWSYAMWRTKIFSRALAVFGLVMSVIMPFAVLSGHLRMSAHGFGVVMLIIGIWSIWAAVLKNKQR